MKRWTRNTALIAFLHEARRIGRCPRDCDLRAPDRICPSLRTYRRLFGSLGAAQLAAGFKLNGRGRQSGWRKKVCIRGHPRTPNNLDRQGHCCQCAAFWKARRGRGVLRPRVMHPDLAAQITAAKQAYWRQAS